MSFRFVIENGWTIPTFVGPIPKTEVMTARASRRTSHESQGLWILTLTLLALTGGSFDVKFKSQPKDAEEVSSVVSMSVWVENEGAFVPCLEISNGESDHVQYTCDWAGTVKEPTNDDPVRTEGYSIGPVIVREGTVQCLIANKDTLNEHYDCNWSTLN